MKKVALVILFKLFQIGDAENIIYAILVIEFVVPCPFKTVVDPLHSEGEFFWKINQSVTLIDICKIIDNNIMFIVV